MRTMYRPRSIATAATAGALMLGALGSAGPALAATERAKVVARADGVTATVSYLRTKSGSMRRYRDLRLTVRAKGRTTMQSVQLRRSARESWMTRPRITLADVTADGLTDVLVDVYTGGAHCCSITSVARSTKHGWRKPMNRNWADYGYKLEDLGGSPLPEFRARDARFTGAYSAFAASRSPVRVFSLGGGGDYVDVTRRFPALIAEDAAVHAEAWAAAPRVSDDAFIRAEAGRAAAVAWVADLLLLGDTKRAAEVVAASRARGDFDGYADPGGKPVELGAQLGRDLKAWGYIEDPTLIGLGDA